jgi:hypothetical protein
VTTDPQTADERRERYATAISGATEPQPEADDTVHACSGRWAGPSCTCFNPEPVQPAADAAAPAVSSRPGTEQEA